MSRRLVVSLTALALAVAGAALVDVTTTLAASPDGDTAGATTTDHVVESFDGTDIAITVFRPEGASAAAPVPLVLHSHGWSGSRATSASGFIQTLLDEGYGVLSIDMRGHGESGGAAHVHSPDHEVRDVSAVLDWAYDELAWTIKQDALDTGHAKDTLTGSIGGSYGGGYQLLTAALDGRLDALAPEITWNDLPYALAPNDAVKSDWVHLLYAAGKAFATLGPEIDEAYREAMLTNEIPEGIVDQFTRSSPASYPDAIDVPTLLIQGVPDTLFNLNQAVWNYEQIAATGADVRLFTHLGGHILNVGSLNGQLSALEPLPVVQPAGAGSPCGDVDDLRLAWFDEHLKGEAGAAASIPRVTLALDDASTCIAGDAWPLVPAPTEVTLGLPIALNQGLAGPSALVPLFSVDEPTAVAGIPTLSGTATVGAARATTYFALAVVNDDGVRVLDSQVTPMRFAGPATAQPFSIELGGVGGALAPGDTLALKLDVLNEQFATNSERAPGGLVLDELVVGVPLVT